MQLYIQRLQLLFYGFPEAHIHFAFGSHPFKEFHMPAGLIALALGGFGIGLTEFVIMGLLPEVAADFQ